MDRETNIDSIRVLDEKIREHEMAVIKLKRARNSLLNISKLPPEVLGKIFYCNVAPKGGDFGWLDEGSHNFLLVCHHWFEVASRTPELWNSWGDTLKEWARWCRCPRTAPLDLVLLDDDDYPYFFFDKPDEDYFDNAVLWDALRARAAQDTIRRVHLRARWSYLDSIIGLLTANRGEPRPNGMESIILRNKDVRPVDVSNFFARHCFPKLRRLELKCCSTSSWDHLTSQTSVLTTLELDFIDPSPTPTTSQLLSILSSNPALRKVKLTNRAVPDDGGGRDGGGMSSVRVHLPYLNKLRLDGGLQHVIRLLDKLDSPRNMDNLSLTLRHPDVTDISRIVGPYLRDHLQRRDRHQNGPNLRVSSGNRFGPWVGDAVGIDLSTQEVGRINTFVTINVVLGEAPHRTVVERAALDLVTYTPLEEVIYFHTYRIPVVTDGVHARFSNLRTLLFTVVPLRATFPDPNLVDTGRMFRSLEHLILEHVVVDNGDWSPLVTFLDRRVSSGNRLDTLSIKDSPRMRPEVMEGIRGMVRVFEVEY